MLPDSVLVSRLLKHYDPFRAFFSARPSLAAVRAADLTEGYAPIRPSPSPAEKDAANQAGMLFRDREYRWDLGRIRFFVEVLEDGAALDPIQADWTWRYTHPVTFVVLDGNHRLCAVALLDRARIDVNYSGPVDFLKYLKGERRLPKEFA